ncbi:hypothetical protein T09_1226 [Trichinella sp. T9]|nr:hypothetical protein T09_1226 [Trichinella sp. T9]
MLPWRLMVFSSRPSVPLLITNTMDYVIRKFVWSQPMTLSNCVSYGSDVFPCHARELKVLVRSIKVDKVMQCDSEEVMNFA